MPNRNNFDDWLDDASRIAGKIVHLLILVMATVLILLAICFLLTGFIALFIHR